MSGRSRFSNPWHAGRILSALVEYFSPWENHCFTEVMVDGCQADFVSITKAGYLAEVEIKVSHSDWRVEKEKKRFERPRPYVRQMYYAVPAFLTDRIPNFIPAHVGIFAVHEYEYRDQLKEFRPAVRQRAQKVEDKTVNQWRHNCYYRFWQAERRRLLNQARPSRIDSRAAA